MNNKRSIVALLILLMFVIVSCSWLGDDAKSFVDMTAKEKAIFLMSVYNKQYDEYMMLWAKENKTEADVEYLKNKKKALKEVYPYIDIYAGYAENNIIPSQSVEDAALSAVNKLLNM